jgi:hypothetical protein
MLTPLSQLYPNSEPYELVLFNLLDPDACKSLHGHRAAWQECSDIAALDEDHFILVIWPGAAVGETA